MKKKIINLFTKDTICLTFKNIKIALGIKEGTTELTTVLKELVDEGFLSFNKEFLRYYKVPFNKYLEVVKNLFSEDANMSFDDIYSSLEGISKEDLKLVLNDLELGGKVYYDDERDRYYNIPSNFFVNKILELFKNCSDTLTLDDIRLFMNLKMNNTLLINFLKGLEKEGKIFYDPDELVYCLLPSVHFLNILKDIFSTNPTSFSLKDIQALLDKKMSIEELKEKLNILELMGQIYYDDKEQKYHSMPADYFVAKVTEIDEEKATITLLADNDYYKIPYSDSNIRIKDKFLVTFKDNEIVVIKKINRIKIIKTPDLEEIIYLFYPYKKGLTYNAIKSCLGGYFGPYEKLKAILMKFESEGILFFDEKNALYYPLTAEYIKAEVEFFRKGLMFIRVNGHRKALPESIVSAVIPNDVIIVKKIEGGFELVKILERYNDEVVCEITENGIQPVSNSLLKVHMDKKELESLCLPMGTRILVKLLTTKSPKGYDVEYLKTIGHKNDFDAEFDAIAYNNGFITQYTKAELDQLESIPKCVTDEDKLGRIDLTHENIFTIDGSHTKDMDDAVGIKIRDDGNYELTVSIAAVNHYIKFGSPLWQRAERNTTSLYMIERVSHMLHSQVSNGICSLNPGVERLAKTFRLIINSDGQIIDFEIFDAVIKSKKKMTYEEVNQILVDGIIPEGYEEFLPDILKMQELSQILTNRHERDGALEFEGKEVRFVFNEIGQITDVETVKYGPAEKLIENFMVATNEAMAEFMLNLGITFIYRNHEIPFDDKIAETTELLKSIGYKVDKIKNGNNPHLIQKTIEALRTKEEFIVLSTLLLRSMKKAYFSPENKGHFALALKAYSQTTSPIRRFLDLLIQYILDNLEKICDPNYDIEEFTNYVSTMCERASKMERNAEKAEYEADKLYMVDYCMANPDQEYEAFIQEITPHYVIVKTKQLIEGIIYFEDINDGNFEYRPNSKSLFDRKTKEQIFIGSKLLLTLKDANREFRIIYFKGFTPKVELTRKRELPTHE